MDGIEQWYGMMILLQMLLVLALKRTWQSTLKPDTPLVVVAEARTCAHGAFLACVLAVVAGPCIP
jgi:hypothetical protein